jgi:hypothetical protein
MQKKSNTYLANGLILSLILIVIDLVGHFAHLMFEGWFKWLGAIVMVSGLILFCIQYGKERSGEVTFGNVFGFGLKTTSVVVVVIFIFTIISLNLLFPEFKDQIIEHSRADMEAKGNLSEDQMEQALNMTRKFFMPFALIGAIIGTYIIGIIGSLLGAAFTKKAKTTVFEQNP